MILVDTSVWVDHLRKRSPALSAVLEQGAVMIHPFILGELACGNLKNRREILRLLRDLPQTPVATEPEAMEFIERRALMGRGLGYIDVHLLASVVLADDALLWTRDRHLRAAASDLGVAYTE